MKFERKTKEKNWTQHLRRKNAFLGNNYTNENIYLLSRMVCKAVSFSIYPESHYEENVISTQ